MVDKYGDFLLKEFQDYKTTNQQLITQVFQLEAVNKQTRAELDVCKKKCLLYRKERDCYRNFIQSYESEINGEKYFDLSKDVFTKLDHNLVHYHELTHSLEEKISVANDNLAKSIQECQKLKEDYDKLKVTLETSSNREKELSTELDQTRSKCSHLEEKLNRRDEESPNRSRDSEDQRILHLKNNPVDNRIAQVWEHYQSLIKENERLKTRLEIIEQGHSADITRMVNDEINSNTEIENLKIALQASEKKRLKLIEEFKRTSKEFREAIICLTGYRIELKSINTYRVSFLYADSSDYLLFKAENKDVELLETEFSKKLTNYIKLYLEKYDSYPAFLAALSLDIFKKANAE